MAALLALLIVVLFIALIVGLINPSRIVRWSKKPTRWKVFLWWLLATIVVFVLIGIVVPKPTPQEIITSAEANIEKGHYESAIDDLKRISQSDSLYSVAQLLMVRADSLCEIAKIEKENALKIAKEEKKKREEENKEENEKTKKEKPSKWKYVEEIDKMDNTKKITASLESDNSIKFDFPYGNSDFTLYIRTWQGSTDVFLTGSNCQFIAGVMGENTYRVKFDDETPINVSANHSTSGGAMIVFLGSEQKIISKLKTAEKLIIEAEFYEAGYEQITFSTKGLKWE